MLSATLPPNETTRLTHEFLYCPTNLLCQIQSVFFIFSLKFLICVFFFFNEIFASFLLSFMASHSNINVDLTRQWYEIRDLLLGHNYLKQDVKRAIKLATVCKHPDAYWLTVSCARKNVKTSKEVRDVFLSLREDPRALCFSGLLGDNDALLRCAAETGYAFAQAMMAEWSEGKERFDWAQRAALQGERDGFHRLGFCYEHGDGCEKDVSKAKEKFSCAAALDHVYSMTNLGQLMDTLDPKRWMWWGRAAARGAPNRFVNSFILVVKLVKNDDSVAPNVFAIGRALKGHVNAIERQIFGSGRNFDDRISPANEAIAFFSSQCAAARKAVDTWTIIAVRAGNLVLNKDMRRKISQMIWNAREQASYPL